MTILVFDRNFYSKKYYITKGYNTGQQKKKKTGIKFKCSDSFSPAEYENESYSFSSGPDSAKFYDKGLKINKIYCL